MAHKITGRIGVIGDPVEHSLSPAFQQPAFDALGIDVRYELWHTPEEEIDERIRQMREGEIYGANITVPHKETFFDRSDVLSDVAHRAGAVNTVVVKDGRIHGDNTDVYGFSVPLIEQRFEFDTSHAMVIGAGGAARGVAVALLDAGIALLTIANRTVERAQAIADALGDQRIHVCSLQDAPEAARDAQLAVNATALGWGDEDLPFDRTLFENLIRGAIAYDLTYRDTVFLREASEAGLNTIDGLGMLVHQGVKSFEIWTGEPAPVDLMLQAAQAARSARRS